LFAWWKSPSYTSSRQPAMYVDTGLELSKALSVATSMRPMSSGVSPLRSINRLAALAPIVTMSSYVSGNDDASSPRPFVYFSGESPFAGANVSARSSLSFPVQISIASMPTAVIPSGCTRRHMGLSMLDTSNVER
jgi:hypothetical protein